MHPFLEVTDDTPARALTIDTLSVGMEVRQRFVFDAAAREAFALVARDRAPVHDDPRFARAAGFEAPIVQGLAVSTRFSRLIGMYLPGEHAILQNIELSYRRPVYAGMELIYACRVERLLRPLRAVQLSLSVSMQGVVVVEGGCRCVVK